MHTMTEEEWRASVEWVGIVAGCVIQKDGKFLLVQEKQEKVFGLWNLPASYVERGESFEDAAVREAKEETGYDVQLIRKIAMYHESAQKTVKHIFLAEVVSGELAIQTEELLDVRWLSLHEVEELETSGKLRAPWTGVVIRLSQEKQA